MKIPGSYPIHYEFARKNPEKFWGFQAEQLSWLKAPKQILRTDSATQHRWFADGELNMAYLALDYHVRHGRANQPAFIFDSPVTGTKRSYSYAEVLGEVAKLAGALLGLGIEKGDTVLLYLPSIPEAAFAMLACARIGAIHVVVFGGFGAHELALRINDAKPKVIISASAGYEVDQPVGYKPQLDEAIYQARHKPLHTIIVQRPQLTAKLIEGRDYDYQSLVNTATPADYVALPATHPLYLLYTSGTAGLPKGVVRDTGGYAVATKYSMSQIFDVRPGETIWAASDLSWLTGHTVLVYGALLQGATSILFEGKPVGTPDAAAFARVVEEYKVSVLITAPTAIRAIRLADAEGALYKKHDLSSLNHLFLVDEPLDAATLQWSQKHLCPSVQPIYWQTESGYPIAGNMAGLDTIENKEGSVTHPVCGFDLHVLTDQGQAALPNQEGAAVLKLPLPPGFMTGLWNNQEAYHKEYLSLYPGYYNTGDGAYVDANGYVYITGRLDELINISGHRLSTAEMEAVIAQHPAVAECVVIGISDEMRGQVPIGFVVKNDSYSIANDDLELELIALVRQQVGAVAVFRTAIVVKRLPRTTTGRIMRKTMRKIADGDHFQITATVEDPAALTEIREALQQHATGAAFRRQPVAANRIRTREEYDRAYKLSVEDPERFWADQASYFKWRRKWSKVMEGDMSQSRINWFVGGKLNITENMLDRHLETRGNKLALIWEPNDPKERFVRYTYRELYQEVNKFANILKNNGVKKGDRVAIYMPMVPELAFGVMACARIGAIHSVVFAGFSASALADRINDAAATVVLTSDGIFRGAKQIPAKAVVDEALESCFSVQRVIVVERTQWLVNMVPGRDVWYHDELRKVSDICPAEEMDAEDPLFILYTSGSTGKPKGIQHSIGGYMVYTDYTFRNVFQIEESSVYWCTADIGWVTGHSYILYGPLLAGATTLMFEGIPTHPDPGRFWQVIDKFGVNQFYTAPTAIRSLMALGDDHIYPYNLHTLKTLGSVGEPINEEAWRWYHIHIGKERAPIVDTWWQTETGGIMITSLSGITPSKPTHAGLPMPGVQPVLLDAQGKELEGNDIEGLLCIKHPWPSMLRTIWGDHERCLQTYFAPFPGYYFTGDGARRDETGLYRIIGRVDDVINVSGHRFGTAEIEDAINMHEHVVESAVVGYPHDIKGQGIFAYVICQNTDKDGKALDSEWLRAEITEAVIRGIGRVAKPDKILIVSGLPKTRSGKIMRRILRKVAEGDTSNLGDTSTLLDPNVVDDIKTAALQLEEQLAARKSR